MTIYSEFDPFAASWLSELIADGLIAQGTVDARDIRDIVPTELVGHRQIHLFAGIGVWSLALRLAGVPDDLEVWTASCPCQPFSSAGKRGGTADERHLWPAAFHLIRHCRPPIVMGEQVASPDGLAWLDTVLADLEAEGYSTRAVDLCAAGVGAPHIRQRLYWLATLAHSMPTGRAEGRTVAGDRQAPGVCGADGLAYAQDERHERSWTARRWRDGSEDDGDARGMEQPDRVRCERGAWSAQEGGRLLREPVAVQAGEAGWLGDADIARPQGRRGVPERADQLAAGAGGVAERLADTADRQLPQPIGRPQGRDGNGSDRQDDPSGAGRPGPTNGLWRDPDWLLCRDAKWRPVEPGTFPLADARAFRNRVGDCGGESGSEIEERIKSGSFRNRVNLLRGAGNAINVAQAQAFIRANGDVIA